MAKRTLGILVPEFPGQTHIFFWREANELARLGVASKWFSTRRPPPGLVTHEWSEGESEKTVYLTPLGLGDIVPIVRVLAAAALSGKLPAVVRAFAASELTGVERVKLLAMIALGAKLAHAARQAGVEHLHVHSCAKAAYVAVFAKALASLDYSLTLHNPLAVFGPDQKLKWSNARFAIVITEALEREVREELEGFLPEEIAIAPMGVDTATFSRSKPYAPWTGGPVRLVQCARLNYAKGYEFLFEAVRQLRDAGLDVRLDVLGEDDEGGRGYRRRLEALRTELGLEDVIALRGACPEAEVIDALQAAHVYVLASINEPLGVATMEAMAMETPALVTAAGGSVELVEDGVTGILVPPQDPAALAAGVRRYLDDPELARRVGAAARERVIERYSSRRSATTIERLMRR
ncbi:MAG: exopolysaccharide biosynthesis GT4 family glycosyltransferase EpsE [Pseudomonadales bacterium]|jgi:glycosyltransferase involved in cell wall biosynthesis|nr:exopolysaccharide biosynthesis GT4 family glycosyltransferase EpsE [Pseudomonadales bacterium]